MVSFLVLKYLFTLCDLTNSSKRAAYIYPCKVKNCYVILSLAEDIGGKLFSLCEEDDWKEYKISNLGQRLLKELREKVDNSYILRRLSSSQRSESDILGPAIPLTV